MECHILRLQRLTRSHWNTMKFSEVTPENWQIDLLESTQKWRTIMQRSQFSTEQIIKILDQAEREEQSISAICRAHAISETTFYRWRKQFGGMTVADAQRLKDLEKENARLKRLLAERDLEVDALKALLAKKA